MIDQPAKRLLKAEWLFPAAGPLQRACSVLIENDRIVTVGESKALQREHPGAEVIDFGNAIILPGLINAHTHLELSACTCGESPTSFVDWILSMPRRIGREPNQRADDLFAASARAGIEQCLRFGVTCVGDISQQMHATRPILREASLRGVSYGEVIGLGKRRARFEELLPLAIDESAAGERLRIGLSPHSPYTIEPDDLAKCVRIARQREMPLAMHLAETAYEREFLSAHTGPLREMWEAIGSWEDFPSSFNAGPIRFAQTMGLLDDPTLLAHVNYCDDDELAILSRGQASVVYCPRTHKYFGHPPHRWREMIERGINVAVGTDSCASSPDLNLVDELRLLHEIAPQWPVEMLWRMATVNAAKAIRWEDLSRAADFVIFDVATDHPLAEILEDRDRLPREVWIAGRKLTDNPLA